MAASYVVLGGSVELTCGRQSWTVDKNEMILLRRAQSVSYEKQGSEETGLFESHLLAINDELLKDFLTSQQVQIPNMKEEYGTQVSPMSERLVAYCWSLSPYFNDPSQVNPCLLRLKVMELLYNVMDCSQNIFRQMLRSSSLSVADVAYSLGFENPTHFSRIFKQQYGYAPSQSGSGIVTI